MDVIIAAVICLIALAAEGVLSGDASAFLKQIKQPRWALPLAAWIVIGLLYYAACFFTLTRLLALGFDRADAIAAFAMLGAVMAANAGFNWVFFKQRDFRAAFYYHFPYFGLTAALIWLLTGLDMTAALVFAAYACYLPYALFWSYRVWKLN